MAIHRGTDEVAYSFFKLKNTDETHIFKGRFLDETCNIKYVSICKKVDRRTDEVIKIKSCLNENETRSKAASIGRDICGICVSHLYTTYEE